MTAALHLAPLAARGIIAGPIDLYESSPDERGGGGSAGASSEGGGATTADDDEKEGSPTRPFRPPDGAGSGSSGRPIGVGIWNTALQPLSSSSRRSHRRLASELDRLGRWVGDVGYRTPGGSWLARSRLDDGTSGEAGGGRKRGMGGKGGRPEDGASLLFLREMDLLGALREAVEEEESEFGTIRTRYGEGEGGGGGATVDSIVVPPTGHGLAGRLAFVDAATGAATSSSSSSSPEYHLIVAADGLNSTLRRKYAGRTFGTRARLRVGLTDPKAAQDRSVEWERDERKRVNEVEDRGYTVFRGNAPALGDDWTIGFQTWGTGKSMRFACVPMSYPNPHDGSGMSRIEKQVWFVTTCDRTISSEPDPVKRRELLLESFGSWHNPVGRLIESTPPEDILVERAVAHRHSVGPILNVGDIIRHERLVRKQEKRKGKKQESASSSVKGARTSSDARGGATAGPPGPMLAFVGDASMAVDPVLAQGFTIAMEDAHALARSVERVCDDPKRWTAELSDDEDEEGGKKKYRKTVLGFDPRGLRSELKRRHRRKGPRLLCLLRATELVQALAQPSSRTVSGWLSRLVVRPAMKLAPGFVKRRVFDSMLRYSLGMLEDGGGGGGGNAEANRNEDGGGRMDGEVEEKRR